MKSLMFKDGHSAPVGNIYCIGRSYAEHISELGNTPNCKNAIAAEQKASSGSLRHINNW